MKKRSLISILLIFLILLPAAWVSAQTSPDNPTAEPPAPTKPVFNLPLQQIEGAIRQSLVTHREQALIYLVYETQVEDVKLASDGKWATAYLVAVDPNTQEVIPTEPGLAIAERDGDSWIVYLPGDAGWRPALENLPPGLMPPEVQEYWLQVDQAALVQIPLAPLTGYLLPWEAGRTLYLSRSVGHDKDIPSGNAHYSFDFYIPQTMFNIHASKTGRVYRFKDTVANGDPNDVNYLVLEDTTTVPTTYQLYLHLAQGSIPPTLKIIGTQVQRGQFIAVADDTGQSTGHHLHYQVEVDPGSSYWSRSVDIIFSDVSINGGRPRNEQYDKAYCRSDDACSQFSLTYVSQNTVSGDRTPPEGDLTAPENGSTLSSNILHLAGWANDAESGFSSASFLANYDGVWREIGTPFSSSPFALDWDLCTTGVPAGPLSVALRLYDRAGNITLDLPGLRHLTKNLACSPPPPACQPGSNEITLYSAPDFYGACTRLGTGSFTGDSALGSVGENDAESIRVDANVNATLYYHTNYDARSETFVASDRNLSDNRTGANTLSSIIVRSRSSLPNTPILRWPENAASFSSNRSLSLVWDDSGGGTEYQAHLVKPGWTQTSGWLTEPVWQIGTLPPGAYTWAVKTRNSSGESGWSSSFNLNISDGGASPSPSFTAPFSDNMEGGVNQWRSSGNWDQTNIENHTSNGAISWWYDVGSTNYNTGQPNSGDLTSPAITIPSGSYYLRFWYKYETESAGPHWDQRWVQISTDGGPFTNLLQLTDDPPNIWLQSPAINLTSYSGHSIRVRFYFVTLDASQNAYKGWSIDDFSITTSPPPACSDGNDTPNQALPVTYGNTIQAAICPSGDVDYYRFTGNLGDIIGALAAKQPSTSPVDTYLFLLDSDAETILAENDDIEYAVITDSFIHYTIQQTGTYYIKVRSWANPAAGGVDHTYSLTLTQDQTPPQVVLNNPPAGTYLPGSPMSVTAQSSDTGSGVRQVEFYFHSGDWLSGTWSLLGTDQTSQDGWTASFDPAAVPDQLDMAIYAKAVDWAGNAAIAVAWGLGLDRTAPASALQTLPATSNSTAVHLSWNASDNLSGIDHFDLQRRIGSGSWVDAATDVAGDARQAWQILDIGNTYSFRMRAVDRIGNTETYPSVAEASTSIPSTLCTVPDPYETTAGKTDDNISSRATQVTSGASLQIHNICNPSQSNHQNDEDWIRISVPAGKTLFAGAIPLSESAALHIELFASDGTTMISQEVPVDFGAPTSLFWKAPQTTQVFLRFRHIDGRVLGEGVSYQANIIVGDPTFLPILAK